MENLYVDIGAKRVKMHKNYTCNILLMSHIADIMAYSVV